MRIYIKPGGGLYPSHWRVESMSVSTARIAVIQFPGSNCETESVRAMRMAGLEAEAFRWNRSPEELGRFDGYFVPGGFSYEDRIRAGVVAAKEPLLDRLSIEAAQGKPVLGVCNGAQILLETGLLPGLEPGKVQMALAHNYMTVDSRVVRRGHHCGWVNVRVEVEPERTPFTRMMKTREWFPLTVSHGEGRFTTSEEGLPETLEKNNQIVWRYCDDNGELSTNVPVNPNGSLLNIAGLCNPAGTVVALMPHPERSYFLRQVPSSWRGEWGNRRRALERSESFNEYGPGFAFFQSLREFFNQ